MTVNITGYSTITGQPEAILEVLKDARIFEAPMSDEDYIKSVQQTAWRCFNITLEVTGDTPAERAESLLRQLASHKLITIIEEEAR